MFAGQKVESNIAGAGSLLLLANQLPPIVFDIRPFYHRR